MEAQGCERKYCDDELNSLKIVMEIPLKPSYFSSPKQ